MEDCKSVSTPMKQKEKLQNDNGVELVDKGVYKILIGCMMYLTTIRLDILFPVTVLSTFLNCVTELHIMAGKRVSSKKQETVEQSTVEEEVLASIYSVNQALCLRKVMMGSIDEARRKH
ncbi:uncharacterized protein LOC132053836 [Lycium ferocissimum]|uniref:uncharacterized protein LOC132053836 n=1 Tax=Lycium ferocissimum TaxID=112874 RepID=UPI002815E350|nr:uncharacterized protein LOC132053836 [Lycium ferocissimum]